MFNMKIKIVASIQKYNKELNKKIHMGIVEVPETGLVMTPETFNKVFSPERIKLLQKIYRNNIKSIYQLAKELNKPYEVVFRNIQYLAGMGLLEIKKKDNKTIPQISSELSIDMFSSQEVEA